MLHDLLQEEGIALRPRNQAACLSAAKARRPPPGGSRSNSIGILGQQVGRGRSWTCNRSCSPSYAGTRAVVDEQDAAERLGRLSTRRSRRAWVSESIQCRFSNTRMSGCTWLSRSSRLFTASRVRWRRWRALRCSQAASSTATSSSDRARLAGFGLRAASERQQLAGDLLADASRLIAALRRWK